MTPSLTDFGPCAEHTDRACPSCYGIVATEDEIRALLDVHGAIEAAGLPQQPSTEGLESYLRVHPPIPFGLVTLLSILRQCLTVAEADPARVELAELARIAELDARVMELLATFRGKLETRGRTKSPAGEEAPR